MEQTSNSVSESKVLQWTITLSLLAVSAGFPIVQAIYEAVMLRERPHVLEIFRRWPSKASLHAWDEAAKDRSLFGKTIRPAVLQSRFDYLRDHGTKSLPGKADWLFYRPDVDYLLHPSFDQARFYEDTYDTLVDGKWVNPRNPLAAISRFRDQLKERGIELLVVPIPVKPDIYPENLAGKYGAPPPSPTLNFHGSLGYLGIATVDLHAVLLQAKQVYGDALYLHRDTHWTPNGLKRAARAIADEIRKTTGIIPMDSSLRRVYGTRIIPVNRFGDIAEMTKLPNRRKYFGMEKVDAEQVWDSTANTPYRDDPRSSILWLGDSFSRIYQTDEPKSAGVIAHVARELGFPLTSIVNDGGASTVVRQQLARKPELLVGKKLVVWTFVERDIRFGDKGWALLDLPKALDQ